MILEYVFFLKELLLHVLLTVIDDCK